MTNTNKEVKVFAEKTIAQKFAEIRDLPSLTDEMREFLDKEIEKLAKKKSYKAKGKSEEHDKLESAIVEVLEGATEPLSASLISVGIAAKFGEYVSTQKITPRCKALVENGVVTLTTEKRVNKYKVAE